jgi:protein-tyrosine phosphatase
MILVTCSAPIDSIMLNYEQKDEYYEFTPASFILKQERYGDRVVGAETLVTKLLYNTDYPSIKHHITPVIPGILYLGGVNDINKAITLYGVTHVLNCAKETHIKRKRIPEAVVISTLGAEDAVDYPIIDLHLDQCIRFINQALLEGGRVFIHCKSGINRSVALAIGYCMKILREDYISCVRRLNDVRPGILRNKHFVRQLNKLYRVLTDS